MFFARLAFAAVIFASIGLAGFVAFAWRTTLPPIDPPSADRFAPDIVRHGATLAAIGNCAGCHSAPERPAYSGGIPVETPFGIVYGTNITPDPDQGIGRWSEAAFRRAMQEGVDREGRHLYPAFPYNHFTKATAADIEALYAFVMTRTPGRTVIPANTLPFPLNIRLGMAGWNALFFRPGTYVPDERRDAAWNRGAYLVEGLGHCGACHTPHNLLGAEKQEQKFAGGMAEGWNSYPLNAASPAPIPWTVEAMGFYLGHGWHEQHGISRGPMANVTANLATVPTADLSAMGTYLVDLMGVPSPARRERARALLDAAVEPIPGPSAGTQAGLQGAAPDRGTQIYATACQSCHAGTRPLPFGGLMLAKSTAIHAADPTNIVIVTLNGLPAAAGEPSSIMPGFAGTLDDGQIVDLLAHLRGVVAGEPPWPALAKIVADVRRRGATLHPSDGTTAAPADPDVGGTPW